MVAHAMGSHSFTCHPHFYLRMERATLPLLRKRSPHGATLDQSNRHFIAAYYSFIDPDRMVGMVYCIIGVPVFVFD